MFRLIKAQQRQAGFNAFLEQNGKGSCHTTFMSDFTIADAFGIKAIKDTYKSGWQYKDNVEYMAEFVAVLNHKIWEHYGKNNTLAKVYNDLWLEADEKCRNHFKGEELSYYYDYLD
jgi:hypothetical protein